MILSIDTELCTGCGVCVKICPFDALKLRDGKAVVDESLCRYCGACVQECRFAAISMQEDEQPVRVNSFIDTLAHAFFNNPKQGRTLAQQSDTGMRAGRGIGRGRRGGQGGRGRRMGRGRK